MNSGFIGQQNVMWGVELQIIDTVGNIKLQTSTGGYVYMSDDWPMRKPNRQKKLAPKSSGPIWCGGCDRQLIFVGQKCSHCGRKDTSTHLKKNEK